VPKFSKISNEKNYSKLNILGILLKEPKLQNHLHYKTLLVVEGFSVISWVLTKHHFLGKKKNKKKAKCHHISRKKKSKGLATNAKWV
jgi:hypothetical protein